ncbi:MAG TPA: ATP-binding protein [Cyanobacteria bacterium UBA11369]|nr:ATP-binding protein [Cyanobacteria bacterium UBA11371]HBE32608.1 ATP-binding protein [Cyanobacteria bacterium UBA11368]HBE47591.1 ATP-binding protein [Cyanobacteria bacterium UBA11369]
MNIFPPLSSAITPISAPTNFQRWLQETSQTFVGRQFAFAALSDFFQRCDRGYFTLTGSPGIGKTAILAKYLTEHPNILYYSAQHSNNQHPDYFLHTLCTQLLNYLKTITADCSYEVLPNNATQGSNFLSLLLQKISDKLPSSQPLIIALDALDRADLKNQPPGSNLFYLPRYLPPRIYFFLSRRPFPLEKSGLLIEAPNQTLNLDHYLNQNQLDIQTYFQQSLTSTDQGETIRNYLNTYHISEAEFCQTLTIASENNFMYLSKLIPSIAQGAYLHPLHSDRLFPELEHYYQQHWQQMKGKRLSSIAHLVLRILVQQDKPMSVEAIAATIGEDEYEVAKVLENWIEFLNPQLVHRTTCYKFYHSSFRNFLSQQLS